jgi:hypothetical protein
MVNLFANDGNGETEPPVTNVLKRTWKFYRPSTDTPEPADSRMDQRLKKASSLETVGGLCEPAVRHNLFFGGKPIVAKQPLCSNTSALTEADYR